MFCFVLLLGGLGFFSQHVLKTSKEIVLDIAGSKAGHWLYQGLIYQKEVQLQLVQANSLYKEKSVLTAAQLKDLDSAVQSVGFSINSYELEVKKPSEVELAGLKKMKDQFATAKAAVEAMKQIYLKAGATSESLTKATNDINDLFLVLCDTFDETATAIRNKNIDYNVVMEASEKKNSYILYSIWLFSFIIATITFLSSKRITNTLLQVTDHFNKMGQQVSSVGDNILGASQNLSVSSTSQASAIQETSASVEEITSMVTRTAENSKHGQTLGIKTKEATVQGKKSIDQLILEINNIEKRNEELAMQIDVSNQQLASIVTLVSDIGVKTKSIDEIVFQTKLLSFNASVEAARAGESGKGFAVVAEEVGNLAKLSGEISKDINLVLENGIQKAQALVSENKTRVEVLVNAGQEAITRGSEVAEQCGTVFEGIVSTVEQVNHLLIDISQANSEQSTGMRQIAKAMDLIDQSSQSTTAASSETSDAAESLAQQTNQLANLVSELTLITRGRNEKTKHLYLNQSQNENSLRASLA